MSRPRVAMRFTDSKLAPPDFVITPSKRLSFWELIDAAEKNRVLKAKGGWILFVQQESWDGLFRGSYTADG
jgi:hypothetical protein